MISFTVGIVLTEAELSRVTASGFSSADLAVLFNFLDLIGVGFWIASVLHE